MKKDQAKLPLYFLGPKSENRPFMADTLNLVLNDYVFWRRNFYPKDPPVMSYSETRNAENEEFRQDFTNELFTLLADLKLDPPFFSPRYMAHMLSETALPAQIAYIATLLYNPNNVSSEASPVTINYELEVGKQLSQLMGQDESKSFAHITSNGTIANYQSLYYHKTLRLLPLAIGLMVKSMNLPWPNSLPTELWEMGNIPYERFEQLTHEFEQICQLQNISTSLLKNFSAGHLGDIEFKYKLEEIFGVAMPKLVIIVPSTAHYSWSRGAKLIGLGSDNLIKVKLTPEFQMDMEELKQKLEQAITQKTIILQLVSVYGTTEFGSFDPVHHILQLKKHYKQKIFFPVHLDAAYGGYFNSMLIDAPKKNSEIFNFQDRLQAKFQSLRSFESFTVDPHKLGLSPFGAGAFIFKYGDLKRFLSEEAMYCFNPQGQDLQPEVQIGKYILDGSKPGASASAVYFNHKLIPLNYKGFGRLLEKLCMIAEEAYLLMNQHSHPKVKLLPVHRPQSNILCFTVIDLATPRTSRSNQLMKALTARFGIKKTSSIQEYDYIISNTTLDLSNLGQKPEFLQHQIQQDTDQLVLGRMVFMNQWHNSINQHGKIYLEDFIERSIEFLEKQL